MRKVIPTLLIAILVILTWYAVRVVWTNENQMKNLAVRNNLEKFGVTVIEGASPEFNNVLKHVIGQDEDIFQIVEASKPFVLFIRNTSGKEVVGISLQWTFVSSTGDVRNIPQIESNPGVLEGIKPRSPAMIGKTSLINNDAFRFISFNTIVAQEVFKATARFSNPAPTFQRQAGLESGDRLITFAKTQRNRALENISEISVSVDGILFNDGTFVGEDKNLYFETMRGRLEARRDFLRELHSASRSGKSETDILTSFVTKTPDVVIDHEQTTGSGLSNEETFELSYRGALAGLKREITFKRSKLPDKEIVKEFALAKESDIIAIRKIEG